MLVERDITRFFNRLDLTQAEATRDALLEYVPELVNRYGEIAATYAADWYDEVRAASKAAGAFRAKMVVPDNKAMQETIKRAAGGLFGANPDTAGVLNSITQRAGRYALEGSRQTITESSKADPSARSWSRVARADACEFCQSLVGEYTYEADFEAHEHCDCIAVPNF